MIGIGGNNARLCDGVTRREALCLGAIGALGLSLPDVLRAEAQRPRRPGAKAESVVLFYLLGGQGQLDTWDMRPEAPAGIRGEFNPIQTKVPGTFICEHLPLLAAQADKYTIIRSMHHTATNHNPGAYLALTGEKPRFDRGGLFPAPDDYPNPGAIVAKFVPTSRPVPPFVQLSDRIVGDNDGHMPGTGAGFLKAHYDPLVIIDNPDRDDFAVPELALPHEVSPGRLTSRRELLRTVDRQLGQLGDSAAIGRLESYRQRAYGLVTSTHTRHAFDLSEEPASVRDRYGRTLHGQRLLLARRLVEAGVRFVSVYWGGLLNNPDDYWDTHKAGFSKQKSRLLPQFDQCLSAFLDDLDQRGLLETTLVVVMGEFGRTPKIGQVTANAGTDARGRDHWPFCYSIVLAGGGVRGGSIIGKGDRYTAFPSADPHTPSDLHASIYWALGLEPDTEMHDSLNRPLPISRGTPIHALFQG
jgi:Protein of unknown function (DUF1501)